ncbi:MAG: RNA polymerase sigma factor [Gemmatimonadales bacterium]
MRDQELIGRVLAGDPSAERALYDAHVDRVFRLVYRMAGDLDRAQDYTQETFIKAFSRLGEFRGEAALSTWLGSIAISIALNGLRKVKRSMEREVVLDEALTSVAPQRPPSRILRIGWPRRLTTCRRGTGWCL